MPFGRPLEPEPRPRPKAKPLGNVGPKPTRSGFVRTTPIGPETKKRKRRHIVGWKDTSGYWLAWIPKKQLDNVSTKCFKTRSFALAFLRKDGIWLLVEPSLTPSAIKKNLDQLLQRNSPASPKKPVCVTPIKPSPNQAITKVLQSADNKRVSSRRIKPRALSSNDFRKPIRRVAGNIEAEMARNEALVFRPTDGSPSKSRSKRAFMAEAQVREKKRKKMLAAQRREFSHLQWLK
jgi:hypothetical protein